MPRQLNSCFRVALFALLTAGGSGIAEGGGSEASLEAPHDYRLTYKTIVPRPPQGAQVVETWVPVPAHIPGVQEVRELSISAPIPYQVTVDPVHGNRMVHVRIEEPAADFAITWTALVRRQVEAGQETAVAQPHHLEGDRLAPVGEAARKMAEDVSAVDPSTPVRDRARRIYDHVVSKTEYDKNAPGWGTGDFARVCRLQKGNCADFMSRFLTLTRASGIPARWVSSIALSADHVGCDACGYHCYGHFLADGNWIPVDPSDARRAMEKHPAMVGWLFGHAVSNNIILSMGRDLVLAPPQKGEPVNFLAGPYVEVDGHAVALDGKNRSYTYTSPEASTHLGTRGAAPSSTDGRRGS